MRALLAKSPSVETGAVDVCHLFDAGGQPALDARVLDVPTLDDVAPMTTHRKDPKSPFATFGVVSVGVLTDTRDHAYVGDLGEDHALVGLTIGHEIGYTAV